MSNMPSFTFTWSLDECIGGEIIIRTTSETNAYRMVKKVLRDRIVQLGCSWTAVGKFEDSQIFVQLKKDS